MPYASRASTTRFVFADGDGGTGVWAKTANVVPKYDAPRYCPQGGFVAFQWDNANRPHNVVKMASQAHYDACDFTGSVELAAAGTGVQSYYHGCDTASEVAYLSCSVGSHCADGQKLAVITSSTSRVVDANGAVQLHSRSLAQVMTLLGGPSAMDRGFQTEDQAARLLDVIWCLEDHCPSSATDWDAGATTASCKADVHNLAGYVSRKRPMPNLAHARQYYDEALAFVTDHCPSLAYLSELHLQQSNATAAAETAERLCAACGRESRYADEVRAAFAAASVTPVGACAAPPVGGGLSGGGLGGIIGGAAVALLAAAYFVRQCCRRAAPSKPRAVAAAADAKKQIALTSASGGTLDVKPTPPSLPPSPPDSAKGAAKGARAGGPPPYVV